jgi:hypothetical protein
MDTDTAVVFFATLTVASLGVVFAKRLFGNWAFVMRLLLLAVAGGQLVFLGFLVLAAWVLHGDCVPTELARRPSPRGDKIAYIHDFSCGTTTPHSMNVSVIAATAKLVGPGNVLDGEGLWPDAGPSGEMTLDEIVRMQWVGRDLVVSYNPRLEVFRHEVAVDGTRIRYAP